MGNNTAISSTLSHAQLQFYITYCLTVCMESFLISGPHSTINPASLTELGWVIVCLELYQDSPSITTPHVNSLLRVAQQNGKKNERQQEGMSMNIIYTCLVCQLPCFIQSAYFIDWENVYDSQFCMLMLLLAFLDNYISATQHLTAVNQNHAQK